METCNCRFSPCTSSRRVLFRNRCGGALFGGRNVRRIARRAPASPCLVKAKLDKTADTTEQGALDKGLEGLQKGLDFVNDAEKKLKEEKDVEDATEAIGMKQKKTKQALPAKGSPKSVAELKQYQEAVATEPIQEEDEERAQAHRRLFAAAKKGKPESAEAVIQDMFADGIMPGPRAYHGVIFAYVKAGDSNGALQAIRRAHNAGVMPITESYLVLIHAFVKDGNVKTAEAILASMKRAGADGRQGWLMMVRSLLDTKDLEAAMLHLEMGKDHKWFPDSNLYAALMKEYGAIGRKAWMFELLDEVIESGVKIETGHVNPLLEMVSKDPDANFEEFQKLYELIDEPNLASYNALLRAQLKSWDEDIDESGTFMKYWMQLSNKFKPSAMSMTFLLRAQLRMGKIRETTKIFLDNNVGQATGAAREELVYYLLPDLLWELSGQGLPIDLYRVLQSIALDGYGMPETVMEPNSKGNTFVSDWLFHRLSKLQVAAVSENASAEPMEMGNRMRRVGEDDVLIGFCNCAVDEDGTIVPPSRLSVTQMKAELEARGLPTDGLRADLYQRVKVSRSAWPGIKDEIKRRQSLKRQKVKMERENREQQLMDILGPTETFEKNVVTELITFEKGREVRRKTITEEDMLRRMEEALAEASEADVEENEDADDENVDQTAEGSETENSLSSMGPDEEDGALIQEGAETTTEANSDDDEDKDPTVSVENDPIDPLADVDDLESLSVRKVEELKEVWQDSLELDSAVETTKFSNQTSGAMVAVNISEVVRSLGQMCTLEDIDTMVNAVTAEQDPASALALTKLLGGAYSAGPISSLLWESKRVPKRKRETMYKERVYAAFTTCARICLDTGYPDSALQILERMEEVGISPDPELEEAVLKNRAGDRSRSSYRSSAASASPEPQLPVVPLLSEPSDLEEDDEEENADDFKLHGGGKPDKSPETKAPVIDLVAEVSEEGKNDKGVSE
ncbi:hypothetical protein BSKO_02926 [Bryopsis sp. KO-2023]|nr:hypothetical protein BSKO_02926 [Bryopsis sp. KO-2023]